MPWPYPYAPVPPPQPEKRGPFGLSSGLGSVILVFVVIGIIAVIVFVLIILMIATSPASTGPTTTYDQDVTIAEGGHFKYVVGGDAYTHRQVQLNVTSAGGKPFDVYVMDEGQYDNAYANSSTHAFSAMERFENLTTVVGRFDLPNDGRTYILVIDNVANPLTPNGAVPHGPIDVHLWARIVSRSG